MEQKSTLIVDDHPLFREGLKAILARESQFEVVGEAGNGREGLKMAKQLKPDLAVVDLSLPDKNGIEVIKEILAHLPSTRILVLSMHSKVDYIAEAFRAGATGYMVKGSDPNKLLQGLQSVADGEYFLDSMVSHEVVGKLREMPETQTKVRDMAYNSLTAREQEVLRLLAEGLSSRDVAVRLYISPKTVENHRASIMRKLGIHSAMELVRYAARLGLIDVDLWKG